MPLMLTSPAFDDGAPIPITHTCDGADLSPPLAWSGIPAGSGSLVLLCSDPDAPAGTWYHWAVFDIPATLSGLPPALAKDPQVGGIRQGINDFGRPGWGGPCPPRRHGVHRYQFRLLAIATATLALADAPRCRAVQEAAEAAGIGAEAALTGLYRR